MGGLQDSPEAASRAANKQLERAVKRHRGRAASAPFHYAHAARWTPHHAAAQLQRYAAYFASRANSGFAQGWRRREL